MMQGVIMQTFQSLNLGFIYHQNHYHQIMITIVLKRINLMTIFASFQATNASTLWSYKELKHQKFCIHMHNIATSLNSLPLRQNNISDNDYDVVLINHYSDVLKDHDYLRCTDINEDVRFDQRQHLNLYRKRDDRSWTMTHGCGQCGYRVPVQLELSTFIIYSVGLIVYHHSVGMKSISKRKPHGK